MARRTTWVSGRYPAMLKSARRRKRAPIGGRLGSLADPDWWRAGQMKLLSLRWAVKRMAWSTWPDCTSSRRSRPGRIGRPAASADVHVAGRSALDRRLKTAPEPAVGRPPFQLAL